MGENLKMMPSEILQKADLDFQGKNFSKCVFSNIYGRWEKYFIFLKACVIQIQTYTLYILKQSNMGSRLRYCYKRYFKIFNNNKK